MTWRMASGENPREPWLESEAGHTVARCRVERDGAPCTVYAAWAPTESPEHPGLDAALALFRRLTGRAPARMEPGTFYAKVHRRLVGVFGDSAAAKAAAEAATPGRAA